MTLRYRTALVITILTTLAATPPALAQQYPNKPIRLLIPSPPGGGTDVLGRILSDGLTKLWGQPVVVDNRGGASGRIAAAVAARSTPDGHTLLFTYGGVLTTGLPLFRKLPYHPIKDFAPVAMIAHVPGVLVAHPSFPAKTVAELIQLAKSKPGALNHGASSIGSSSHLNMELFKQMAGIDMLQVSYPGDGPALIALLGGHVPFAFNNVVAAAPHIQSGKLRVMAVATAQRVPNLPQVPTIAESGLPGYEGLLFYALVAPARTPPAIVNRLNDAMRKIKQDADVKQQFSRLGAISVDMTPEELGAFLERELEKWTKVIQAGGIQAD
ncbi:MAG: tripartite tricarboxylate transporter substrate binding protein [Betaproteobacteria bacterium]|nr:tripartite tricarboxylate transporter substrate binding protein [Betaproteobacteria bacterium]